MKYSILSTLLALAFLSVSCSESSIPYNYADCMDISHYQGVIDWDEVVLDTVKFTCVYSKVTEADNYVDTTYRYNLKEAKAHGYKIGGYHYYRMRASAHDNFENYRREYNTVDFDLRPMLDIEKSDGYDINDLHDSLRVFCSLIKEEYGVDPIVYSTDSSYNAICSGLFTDSFLFIGKVDGGEPVLNDGGICKLWQFSWTDIVRGVEFEVDMSRFINGGSIDDLLMEKQK